MNIVRMAAKLYECRDAAKSIFQDLYKEKLEPYKNVVEAVMASKNLEAIPALLEVSKTATYNESGFVQMMFMAAVVEIIEPS
jgi:predicted house-cleaning noncanonical NTP pyrophosphatase (MazG superfamily)